MQNLINQAEVAFNNCEYEKAAKTYLSFLQFNPNNEFVLLRLSQTFTKLYKHFDAFSTLLKVIKINPLFNAINDAENVYQKLSPNAEKIARKDLQNYLELNPNNIGFAMLEAKLLVLDAQNTDNLIDEKNLLIKASNLIPNKTTQITALFLKAQIELYISLNENQNNQKNSTRNNKNFSRKSKQIVEYIENQFYILFPYLKPLKNELSECKKPVTTLFMLGRAGSTFLHTLLDGYPQISTYPMYAFKYLFNPALNIWNKLLADTKQSNNWRENILVNFCEHYDGIFNAASQTPFNDFGYSGFHMQLMGLAKMGKNGNEAFKLNKLAFCQYLFTALSKLPEQNSNIKISLPMMFRLFHYAYEFALNRNPIEKPAILHHLHGDLDLIEMLSLNISFANLQYLSITREPVQMVESYFKAAINELFPFQTDKLMFDALNNNKQDLLNIGGRRLLNAWNFAFNGVKLVSTDFNTELFLQTIAKPKKAATIRLEDIKNHPKEALPKLITWLGVEKEQAKWHQSLESETFGDMLYGGISQEGNKGFDNSHLKKGQGQFFSQNDLRIMNLLLYPLCVKFGYRQKDDEYLQKEIAWYENEQKIETYMDFESKIIARLKQDYKDIEQEQSEYKSAYFYRVRWARRTINFMKKYQEKIPGFAELLEL